MESGERIQIPVGLLEFIVDGNTIWIQGNDGATVLRIKCTGKIKADVCDTSPFSHADAIVEGDINFCVSKDRVE